LVLTLLAIILKVRGGTFPQKVLMVMLKLSQPNFLPKCPRGEKVWVELDFNVGENLLNLHVESLWKFQIYWGS
jgi:hypothetical protein